MEKTNIEKIDSEIAKIHKAINTLRKMWNDENMSMNDMQHIMDEARLLDITDFSGTITQ